MFYFSCPSHSAFHDCTSSLSPKNLRSLLGLGLKFIPTPCYTTTPKELTQPNGCFHCFKQDILLACYFGGLQDDCTYTNRKMYVKSIWEPPHNSIPHEIFNQLNNFKTTMKRLFQNDMERATSCLINNVLYLGYNAKKTSSSLLATKPWPCHH